MNKQMKSQLKETGSEKYFPEYALIDASVMNPDGYPSDAQPDASLIFG